MVMEKVIQQIGVKKLIDKNAERITALPEGVDESDRMKINLPFIGLNI